MSKTKTRKVDRRSRSTGRTSPTDAPLRQSQNLPPLLGKPPTDDAIGKETQEEPRIPEEASPRHPSSLLDYIRAGVIDLDAENDHILCGERPDYVGDYLFHEDLCVLETNGHIRPLSLQELEATKEDTAEDV